MRSAKGENMQRHYQPPRKVIVGTSIFEHYGPWSGLDERLEALCGMIDEKNRISREKYGRNTDLIVFTEHAVTGGAGSAPEVKAHPLEGRIGDTFAAKAREYNTNLCLPMHLEEDRDAGIFTNSAVFLDRQGELAGVYRKIHLVNGYRSTGGDENVLEGGLAPGKEANVIDLDFGRVGAQICYDMTYDDGWQLLRDKGAELVVWPTASPRAFGPAVKAALHGYWVVNATPRCNASIFEPLTGQAIAQVRPPETLLVHEIDLSWLYSCWLPELRDGAILSEQFGDKVGYHYLAEEDCGLFWSNDPEQSIGEMFKAVGIDPDYDRPEQCRVLQERARGGGVA